MAKIVEDVVVIKFSKIVKDSEKDGVDIASPETLAALEQVAQELIGEGVVVEAMKA
jgi:hypothetical protein